MFKKSLLILLVCGLLTLAWIVGYVLLRVRGPVDELRHAEAQLALGQYAQVIAALNQAEHSASIQSSVSLQVRLWRIRAEAQASLDNPAGALKDVRQLLGNGFKDDIELRLDEIRYLATDGQGELARQRAKSLLADHPDHSRAPERAGDATLIPTGTDTSSVGKALDAMSSGQTTDSHSRCGVRCNSGP